MRDKKQSVTRTIAECAMFVALAGILSVFPRIPFLYGGEITICSMLPIVLASYRHGIKWGLLSGLVFVPVRIILTGFYVAGPSFLTILFGVLFDYVLAFTVLGLGGLFREKFKRRGTELAMGGLVVLSLRFVSHIISGVLVWGEWAQDFFENAGAFGQWILSNTSGGWLVLIYSISYNGLYMIPEMIITFIVSLAISKFALFGLKNQNS